MDVIKANPLRFIAPRRLSLPPQVIKELEEVFGAPVIESYGMTEAAHQMSRQPAAARQAQTRDSRTAAGPK